jgi:hypothetical protein
VTPSGPPYAVGPTASLQHPHAGQLGWCGIIPQPSDGSKGACTIACQRCGSTIADTVAIRNTCLAAVQCVIQGHAAWSLGCSTVFAGLALLTCCLWCKGCVHVVCPGVARGCWPGCMCATCMIDCVQACQMIVCRCLHLGTCLKDVCTLAGQQGSDVQELCSGSGGPVWQVC